MGITIVLVTYNRIDSLEMCLKVVSEDGNADSIIIVNNFSTDNSEESLIQNGYISSEFKRAESWGHESHCLRGSQSIHYYCMRKNTGGAGGFSFGIQKAFEQGATWIWVMDDDCLPEPNALKILLDSHASAHDDTGFLASTVRWNDGSLHKMNMHGHPIDFSFLESTETSNCIPTNQCSFVGMLIHRRAVERAGLPIQEFFIWADDTEYSRRITEKVGLKGYYIANSSVIHSTNENIGASIDQLTDATVWKFAYGWRNQIYLTRKYTLGKRLTVSIKVFFLFNHFLKELVRIRGISVKARMKLFSAICHGLWFNPVIVHPQ